MGDDLGPSEAEASAATEDRPIKEIELDLDRMLNDGFRWVCLGKNKRSGELAIFLPPCDVWDDPDELTGFIIRAANPTVIMNAINGAQRKE